MKNEILQYIKQSKGKSTKEVANEFNSLSFVQVMKTLNELEDEELITRDDQNRYFAVGENGYFQGVLSLHKRGFGFVRIDEDTEFFIPKKYTKSALDGDTVLIKKRTNDPVSDDAMVVKIIERGSNHLVGLVKKDKRGYHIYPDDQTKPDVYIDKDQLHGAVEGHKVIVEITQFEPKVKGKIVKIIGHKNDPGVDILSVLHDHNINIDFPKDVYKQIESIGEEIEPSDIKNRVDLRDMLIVSIDGETAKDLDDAVSLRVLENKHYELGVHIADVSYYVTEGSPLDVEAVKRGTSIYLVDRVIPMLPHKLSNGICSLNEGVDRYTISCFMEIDQKGDVVNHKIILTVINNKHRMTYTNVNKILNGNKATRRQYKDSIELFENMEKLSHILTKKRDRRGAIDFDTDEAEIIVDKRGKPVDIKLRSRGVSERMIESFMLVANETVAEHFRWLELPFIYRVHETPKKNKLQQFVTIAKPLGYNIHGSLDNVKPKELARIINQSKGRVEHPVISTLLLRSMQKARYAPECLGHFGLADEFYTHFTSPIRRYPDLLVHRLIRTYLFNEQYNKVGHFEEVIPELADSSSDCERKAIDIEREVEDMKKAEYMSYHKGEKFKGIISSVTSFGMFVELPNTVEGLIRLEDLADDYYEYNEERLMLIGKRKKKIYKLSDPIEIVVKNANKIEKEIDFLDANNMYKPKKKRRRRR